MTEPPPIGISELVRTCDTCLTDGYAVVADGLACKAYAVLRPLEGRCFVHLHFEGGTFVFLYAEEDGRAGGRDAVCARQSTFWQYEVGRQNTHFIGRYGQTAHFLAVGIAHQQFERFACDGTCVPMFLVVCYAAHVNGLPWTVDGAVGVEADFRLLTFLTPPLLSHGAVLLWEPAVVALLHGGDETAVVGLAPVEARTSLRISRLRANQRLLCRSIVVFEELDGSPLNGLSALSIYHDHVAPILLPSTLDRQET